MDKYKWIPVLFLAASILACTVQIGATPAPGTESPALPSDGVTPDVVLPPPVVAPSFQVAYAKSGNIWLWTEAGGSVQLTTSGIDSEPRISPDGIKIAFRRGDEVWVVNIDASDPRAVINSAFLAGLVTPPALGAAVDWFKWEPLNGYLVFGTSVIGEHFTVPASDLWSTGIGGSDTPNQLRIGGEGGPVTFSPDGRYFTIAQGSQIFLSSMDGSVNRVALSYDFVLTYSEWTYLPDVVWFADSSEFRTVIPAHDALGNPLDGTYLWSVPISGSPVEMAGFTAVPAFMDRPRISPDGLNVAYLAPNGSNSDLTIEGFYIGSEIYSSYTSGQWGVVGWSPDSTHFVYWIDDQRIPWLASLGNPAVHLTDTPYAQNVRWADSTRILFLNGNDLRLGTAGGTSSLIDTGVDGGFDFYGFLS